jgi:anti-sigma regulatory factor (Ser/Thr protein kinase)
MEIRSPEARALALLAVEEAAVNILEHGYDREPGRPLVVTFRSLETDRFRIELRDRAATVDVSRLTPGDLKTLAARRSIRGRGVALVRMFTEEVRHAPRRGGGNVLTLIFDAARLSRLAEEHSRDAA